MSEHDDIDDLLDGLDRPLPLDADTEAQLLAGLRSHLALGPMPDESRRSAPHALDPLPVTADEPAVRRTRVGLAMVAAAAAIILAVVILRPDGQVTQVDDADQASSPERVEPVTTPEAACVRFDYLSVSGLWGLFPTETELDDAADSVDQLRADLTMIGATSEAEDLEIRIVAGLLRQAALEFRVDADPTQSIENAKNSWRTAQETIPALATCGS